MEIDIQSVAIFLTGGSLLASLITGVLKQALKGISDKWGALATQALLFIVCLLIVLVFWSAQFVPTQILATAGAIFMGAMTVYEVFYKGIYVNLIKGNQ